MNVKSVEKKEKSTVALQIEVGKEEWESALNKAYIKNRKDISVPGFRKGKAPRKVIEGMYGASVFYDDAINDSYYDALEAAIAQEELRVVGNPTSLNVDEVGADGYTFTAVVGVYPEVTIGEYKGVEAPYEEPAATEAEVDAEIEKLRERNARLETVEREIKDGDTAVIDYEGFMDGVAFEGGKDENHSLVIGSGAFIPGFEDALIGHKSGEELDVNVTFPEQYEESLAGKPATFKVVIHEVKESIKPEVDDEFAKDVSEFDTVAELRADLEKNLVESKRTSAENTYADALVQKIVDGMTAEIPDSMIEATIDNMLTDFENQLGQMGTTLEQYMQYTGGKVEDLRKSARTTAENSVKYELTLTKIAELEGIEVSQEDIDDEIQKQAEAYGISVEFVKKYVAESELSFNIKLNKARDVVVANGVKTAPVAEAAEAPAEEASAE